MSVVGVGTLVVTVVTASALDFEKVVLADIIVSETGRAMLEVVIVTSGMTDVAVSAVPKLDMVLAGLP